MTQPIFSRKFLHLAITATLLSLTLGGMDAGAQCACEEDQKLVILQGGHVVDYLNKRDGVMDVTFCGPSLMTYPDNIPSLPTVFLLP